MKLGTFNLFNAPAPKEVCAALASGYNNISQTICEFEDNAISNLLGHLDDPAVVRTVRTVVRNLGDNVGITIEDGGTGTENLNNAMTLCHTSGGDTPLNASGCGFKSSFSYIEDNGGSWECKTRTKEDACLNRYCCFTAPYDFGDGVFSGEYHSGWVSTLGNTGTVIHFTCPMEVFATLNSTTSAELPSFRHLVSILRENLRYTYSHILQEGIVTMELVIFDGTDEKSEVLEPLTPIWKFSPKDLPPQEVDLGGGPVTIHCQHGTIQGDKNNLFYYKANMASSGAEIAINGRVIARGLMEEIWNRKVHPSQNGFLVRIDLVASDVSAIPMTKAAKSGFREADPKLKALFLWIRSNVPLPEMERDSKEKRLLRKLEEKLHAQSKFVRTTLEMQAFRAIDLGVKVDLLEATNNSIRIYEGKARRTAPLDLYQLRMYWDACVKDGYPPAEGILIGKRHSEDVLRLVKYLNTLHGADGRPYHFTLTTWKGAGNCSLKH